MAYVRIAMIDNGIDDTYLRNPLEHRIAITPEGRVKPDEGDRGEVHFLHGTTCAMIVEKYFPECLLSSVKVLKEDGTGLLTTLRPALEWCLSNEIFLVNLSLGSTHFKDKAVMRALINEYAVKGMLMIAATANSGYLSYPASFSNVIGVAVDSNEYKSFTGNLHLGIDVLVPARQELFMKGETILLQKSNSYAAPYVTALAGKLCLERGIRRVGEIRQGLELAAKEYGIDFLSGSLPPDWICRGQVKRAGAQSKEAFFFHRAEEKSRIDTVITDHLGEAEKGAEEDKNIIYLGKESIVPPKINRFFWSPQVRLKSILDSGKDKKRAESPLPVILCEWEEELDEMYLLGELRRSFYREGYHVYAVSFSAESVLYDLEYIPEEMLNQENKDAFEGFMERETFYRQSDALLLGLPPALAKRGTGLRDMADLQLLFQRPEERKAGLGVLFLEKGRKLDQIMLDDIDGEAVEIIFQKLREIMEE